LYNFNVRSTLLLISTVLEAYLFSVWRNYGVASKPRRNRA
jgi:hypothetical protein